MLHSQYKERVHIVKHYGNVPKIECFPGKINQVFMNVLSNAVQAIADKGTVTVTTWFEGNSTCKISISDTGCGMSDVVKERVFEPFFTTKDVGKGTGLGMSITHAIIEKHKGKIEIKTQVGVGSEFIITLPMKQ
jgi:signal transduction histidine kinase